MTGGCVGVATLLTMGAGPVNTASGTGDDKEMEVACDKGDMPLDDGCTGMDGDTALLSPLLTVLDAPPSAGNGEAFD